MKKVKSVSSVNTIQNAGLIGWFCSYAGSYLYPLLLFESGILLIIGRRLRRASERSELAPIIEHPTAVSIIELILNRYLKRFHLLGNSLPFVSGLAACSGYFLIFPL